MVELEESLSCSAVREGKEQPNWEENSGSKELSSLKDGLRRFAKESLLLILRRLEVGEGEKTLLRELLRSPGVIVFGVTTVELLKVLVARQHVIVS